MSLTQTIADPSVYEGYNAGDGTQSDRLRAVVKVLVGSNAYGATGAVGPVLFQDITDALLPYLISVRCLVGARLEEYQCEIELDDRNGELPIPPIDTPIQCYFGWVGQGVQLVWDGVIHDIEYGFDRKGGGRKMWIHGFGGSFLDKGKELARLHTPPDGGGAPQDGNETGPLFSIAEHLAKSSNHAQQTITVNPKVAAYKLDRFDQMDESYYHWSKENVEKAGGLFRVTGGTKGEAMWQGEDGNGNPLPTVNAVWGKNLISFRVRPMAARPMWVSSTSHFFDNPKSQWKMIQQATGGMQSGMSTADAGLPNPAPNANASQQDTSGQNDGTLQYQGPGKIVMNGEPTATGNGYCVISGVRPGVDGKYWIECAEHIYSRGGYITWCDVIAQDVSVAGKGGGPRQYPYPLFGQAPTTVVTPLPTPPLLGG